MIVSELYGRVEFQRGFEFFDRLQAAIRIQIRSPRS